MEEVQIGLTVKQSDSIYLGVSVEAGKEKYHYVVTGPGDAKTGTRWVLRAIAGTSAQLLVKYGGTADGLVVTFTDERQYLVMKPYDPGNIQQYIMVTPHGESLVILNNHNESNVMDRSMYPKDQGFVIGFPWNGGDNQIWKKHYYS